MDIDTHDFTCYLQFFDLFDFMEFNADFCSVMNGCNLPLPPKKYDFGELTFRFRDTFEWWIIPLLEMAEIGDEAYVQATAKFFSAAGIELGCFNATVNYTLK